MASSCTLFGLFSNSKRFTHTKSQTWTFEKLKDLATVGPHSFAITVVWSWSTNDAMELFPPFVHNTHLCLLLLPAAAAKSLQSCPTLCDPRDGSPPGYPVPGILQARTLEWLVISFSNAWKWNVKVKLLSRVGLLVTPWTAAYQAPPFMGFSRQEYWSGVPLPSLVTAPSPHLFPVTYYCEI